MTGKWWTLVALLSAHCGAPGSSPKDTDLVDTDASAADTDDHDTDGAFTDSDVLETDGLDTDSDVLETDGVDTDPSDTDVSDSAAADTDPSDTDVAPVTYFEPAWAALSFELAFDSNHELSLFSRDGVTMAPALVVEFTDVSNTTCTLRYDLDIAAFNAYASLGGANPSADATDYADWLLIQGLVSGQVVADGLYTASLSAGCVLDPAATAWTSDPASHFLNGAWQMGWSPEVSADVQRVLDDNGGIEALFGVGFDPAKVVGGYLRVPDQFFSDGTRDLEAAGTAGAVDASMHVQVGPGGDLVLLNSADLVGPDGPNACFLQMKSLYGITFW